MATQVWKSDDGTVVGTKEEAEEQDRKSRTFGRMEFPYKYGSQFGADYNRAHQVTRGDKIGTYIKTEEMKALIAFANLAPVIEAWIEGQKTYFSLNTAFAEAKELARNVS